MQAQRQTRWIGMGCAALLAGCFSSDGNLIGPAAGGQTGDEGADGRDPRGGTFGDLGPEGGPGPLAFCDDREPQTLELDADAPLGYSPRQILALAEGSTTMPLHWNPQSAFPYGPEQGESAITITVSPLGSARYVESTPSDTGGAEIGVHCPARVEVDVEVEVVSDGGALDERFDAVLVSRDGVLAHVDHRLDVDALGGSLAFELPAGRNVRVYDLSLAMTFSRYGGSGTLSVGFEETTDDATSDFASPPLASWPSADSCIEGGVPIPFAPEGEAVSGQAALDTVNALPALVLTHGHDTTEVTLELTHDGGAVCTGLEVYFGTPAASGAVDLGGALHLVANDGSLDLELSVHVQALPFDDGTLASVELRLDPEDPCAEWSSDVPFAERCADFGADLSAYDGAHLELDIAIDVDGATPKVTGRIVVAGELQPDCQDTPPEPQVGNQGSASTPGCPGIESQPAMEMLLGK